MSEIRHRLIMLRPMRAGAGGYARVQTQRGQTTLLLSAKGLTGQQARVFWYAGDGGAAELGTISAGAHGEASLQCDIPSTRLAPARLQALIVLSGDMPPVPLLIGLCAQESAGSLLDAKNAAMGLCEKLSREAIKADKAPSKPKAAPKASEKAVFPSSPLPKEIFLPAIDPTRHGFMLRSDADARSAAPPVRLPVGRLPVLRWPKGFEHLQKDFDSAVPCGLFSMPGWRFIESPAQRGLFIGRKALDGSVHGICYASCTGALPKAQGRHCRAKGCDGHAYDVLWMDFS